MKNNILLGGTVGVVAILLTAACIPLYSAQTLGTDPTHPFESLLSPNPKDGATDVSIDIDISWINSAPRSGAVSYDVYFGTQPDPPRVASHYIMMTYDPGRLAFATTYYWKIVTCEENGEMLPGPIWRFTTQTEMLDVQPPSKPTHLNRAHTHPNDMNKGIGRFTWNEPGGAVQPFTTTSNNIGLIYYQFNWDDGTSSDWVGPYTSGQTAVAFHDFNTIGYFNVTVIARVGTEESLPSPALMVRMYLLGDVNGDNHFDMGDVDPFTMMLSSGKNVYYQTYPNGYWFTGDINQDGVVDYGDIEPFVALLSMPQNQPPYIPSNPNPPDGAINVDVDVTLSWTGGDPDPNDTVKYDVYFGVTNPPPKVLSDLEGTTYHPKTLLYNTRYYWRIVARDSLGAITPGPLWSFTTISEPNHPPYIPYQPSPPDGAINIPIEVDIRWLGGDPDLGDTVTYDVYFGTTLTPVKVSSNQSALIYHLTSLKYLTTYYWKIVAWDNHNASAQGPIWRFTTIPQPNQPPYIPSNPIPLDGESNVEITIDLSWNGGDPDPDDSVTYNISFGLSGEMSQVATGYPTETYDPGELAYNTTYEWQITARDNHGVQTEGPIWRFTTRIDSGENQPPDRPTVTGPSIGTIGIDYTFTTSAIDPNADQLYYNVSWGDGNYTGWIGPYTSSELVQIIHAWATPAIYHITVIAKDEHGAESGWSDPFAIDISLMKVIDINNIKEGYLYIRLFNDKSFGYIHLLDLLNMSAVLAFSLVVNASVSEEVVSVRFNLTRLFTGENIEIVDDDLSDGAIVDFQISTGFFSITVHAFDSNESEIGNQTLDSLIFLNPSFGASTTHQTGLLSQRPLAQLVKNRLIVQRHR